MILFRERLNSARSFRALSCWVLLAALAGCAGTKHAAPVEDRNTVGRSGGKAAPNAEAPKAPVKAEPGYYIVKAGDTLARIAFENGQSWKDVARWNSLDNPNVIEVGQVLRVVPPGVEPGVAVAKPVAPIKVESKPLDARPTAPVAVAAASAAVPTPSTPAAKDGDEDLKWAWPAAGAVITGFDDVRSKGLSIAGKAGDPVLAAADGQVVYAGSGLRGYGNLIIVKHNATYLTAYAHNQSLLVTEDQQVKRGQKIAEMGASDAEKVQLHFEIRKLGKPIDPAKLLPAR
jgi:lipoprotein NlpD